MSKFRVSYSALQSFHSDCQARYMFYQEFDTVVVPPWFQFGNAVHKYMETRLLDVELGVDDDVPAWDAAEKMWEFLESKGYKLIGPPEREHLAYLTPEIDVYGKIDRLAIAPDGKMVVLDYKTAKSPWSVLKRVHGGTEHVALQSVTWQGEIYMHMPYDAPEGVDWPEATDFIVFPKDGGPVRAHRYNRNAEGRLNLIAACEAAKEAKDLGRYPKNFGYACGDCKWKDVCWNIPNWEKKYKSRTKEVVE